DLMARVVGESLHAGGLQVQMMPLSGSHRSDLATEVLEAGALVVGSPTLNNQAFPTVVEALSYLKGLKPSGRVGGAFGSYGWSGEAVRQVEEALTSMGMELAGSTKTLYVPGGDTLAACHTLGLQVASALQERLAGEPQPA
ncbi:MAG TPA: FprA family A-type flavoprotein, partial [Holophaga sp.]|nr:FprA family A-type flavoprotein [Holophaga sp.]